MACSSTRQTAALVLVVSLFVLSSHQLGAQGCKAQNSPKRMVCYFASWAGYRASPAGIRPEDVDPCLCTHVLYSFAPISNGRLSPGGADLDLINRMKQWKNVNPNIKISLSVGGWTAQVSFKINHDFWTTIFQGSFHFKSGPFTPIVESDSSRTAFCQSAIDVCRANGIDGVDIDW